MKQKVGICFGGYCPLHQGHMDVIMKAKKENDVCFLIVCGYENEPRSLEINLSLEERTNLIKKVFIGDEQIIVLPINDTELGIDESMSDNNWKIWQEKVAELCFDKKHWRGKYIGNDVFKKEECDITWYVSEPFYKECIEKNNILNANIKVLEKNNPISGTLIRSNPLKYWQKINREFKPFLCHNILVVGTASEGKTTLVRDISNYFDIPCAKEYGREYMEDLHITDVDLTYNEFNDFLIGQNKSYDVRYQSKNGLFISDTDNCITLMYANAYVDDPNICITKDDYDKLYEEAKKLQAKNKLKWDKIFILPPNKNFIDDGTRYMAQSSMEERIKNLKKLEELIDDFYPETSKTYLTGTFLENYETVKKYIDEKFVNQ